MRLQRRSSDVDHEFSAEKITSLASIFHWYDTLHRTFVQVLVLRSKALEKSGQKPFHFYKF